MPSYRILKIIIYVFFSLTLLFGCCGPSLHKRIEQSELETQRLIAGASEQKKLEILRQQAGKDDWAQKIAVVKILGELKDVKGVPEFLAEMLYDPSYANRLRSEVLKSLGKINSLETNSIIYQYGLKNVKNLNTVKSTIAIFKNNKTLPINFIPDLKSPQDWHGAIRQYFSSKSILIRFSDKDTRGIFELEITNVNFSEDRWKTTETRQETRSYGDPHKKGDVRTYTWLENYDTYWAQKTVQYQARVSVKELDGTSLVSKLLAIKAASTSSANIMPSHEEAFAESLKELEDSLIETIYTKLATFQPLHFMDNVASSDVQVNWEASTVTLPPLLKASLAIESQGAVKAGSTIDLKVTVKNNGRGPAYRLLCIVKAKGLSMEARNIHIGRINAGEELTRRISLNIPLKTETGEVPIEITFKESNDYPPDPISGVIQVVSPPRPHLSYAYFIIDDMERSVRVVGNGDGIFQLGEAVELRINIKNTGETTAENVTLLLNIPQELKGKGVILEDPSGKLGNMKPNEERLVSAVLVAKKTLNLKTIPIAVNLEESRFGSKTEDTINLKIGEETKVKVIAMTPRTAYVTKDKAEVLSAAENSSGAMFRLAGHTPVTVNAQLGDWYRVDLGEGRQGWMNKYSLNFETPKREISTSSPDQPKSPKIIEVFRNSPPTLYIASPKDGLQIEEETIRVESFMFDALGLKSVVLTVNGHPMDMASSRAVVIASKEKASQASLNIQKNKTEYTLQTVIPLQQGTNRVEVKVTNIEGLTTAKFVNVERVKHLVTKLPRIRALVVGVNQYEDPIPSLSYAEADARSMYDLLLGPRVGLKTTDITMLLGKDATRDNILKHLDLLLTKSYPEDLVILYFAMHGYPDLQGGDELYFIPYGVGMGDFRIKAVARSDIRRFLNMGKAGKILFIADACHASAVSAGAGRTRDIPGRLVPLLVKLGDVQGKGIGFLTAASANEVSSEDARYRHGLFTHFLIEGLQGAADRKPWGNGDGFVTLGELSEYIRRQVHDLTQGKQNPSLDPNGTLPRDVPLSRISID
jgi:hypothetical protein